ncbi:MAG: porin [Bacteroidota bacterium]
MKKAVLTICSFCTLFAADAQENKETNPLTVSGYLETYYAYDFGKPALQNRPSFIYSHNRHNEFNLNLGMLKAAYQKKGIRANLALAAGTYMNANLAAEPGILKNIFEANAGVKIAKTSNLWIDAGIFASHIGFETAIGKDCWTLTRGILADNSPYYESGVKLTYTSPNEKLVMIGLLLNGWQRIQRVPGNRTIGIGHQITYKPSAKVTLNSSSFIGNDKPDSIKQMRYFHNFYGVFQLSDVFAITTGFDIGFEQKQKGSSQYNTWYTPVLMAKINAGSKNSVTARLEYYSDPKAVIIATATPNGFKTWGYSLNYDHTISSRALWRIEARGFSSKDRIFEKNGNISGNNFFMSTALAISF